ncbi:MOSC domain-containing protein [Bacillus aquiflavi]|uniref:MOSC domain-containing protein n=1 Tax=Bacillus aquiflavi TaxID=2672567 RepID=A0A6B3W136_9BACI|nr:MOSC domain-containing protein [Bacillus aquiflavi]MBA4536949.1 MOSC domain-containing protein [Bacillus aquiflavi]NEY82335.1 MOSC domain-containing protein [Bacillus aquiflavi]UAC47764.1 MOSC domain-containing protein [Bacillus aquiflavi]
MSDRQMKLVNLNIGLPKKMTYNENKEIVTGICKKSVDEAYLSYDGFQGDGIADTRYHGGPDRAVCVYADEHYEQWEKEFNIKLPSAAFGENLTVRNMLESDICIGDIYQIGEAVVQISQGRIPCSTITKRIGVPKLLKRIVEEGYTGYLCRVLEEGTIHKNATIKLIKPHPNEISILFANEIYFHRRDDVKGIQKILAVQELADAWRKDLSERLAKLI